ncbi:unnamed protein product [Symbiodinium sp. CCMP2592]|nr:unnamed protein product [Symbiodinium sp. CCMP2592]
MIWASCGPSLAGRICVVRVNDGQATEGSLKMTRQVLPRRSSPCRSARAAIALRGWNKMYEMQKLLQILTKPCQQWNQWQRHRRQHDTMTWQEHDLMVTEISLSLGDEFDALPRCSLQSVPTRNLACDDSGLD